MNNLSQPENFQLKIRQSLFEPNTPRGRFKDQFHEMARFKHLSLRMEQAYWEWVKRPKAGDEAANARFKLRKEESGIAHRDEIKKLVDYIDAVEKRI